MPDRPVEPGVWGSCTDGYALWSDEEDGWIVDATEMTAGAYIEEGFCFVCGDELQCEGHVRPNFRRKVQQILAAIEERIAHPDALRPDQVKLLYAQQVGIRALFAHVARCNTCGGTGYVWQAGAPDFPGDTHAITQAQVPCPKCQPAKENDDGD